MTGWNESDLRPISRKATAIRQHEADIAAMIRWLREQGCPWSVIGQALGVTKQAAQQRYGR